MLNRQPAGILRPVPSLVGVEEEKVEEDEPTAAPVQPPPSTAQQVVATPPLTGVPLGDDNSGKEPSPLMFRTAVARMTGAEPLWGVPLWDKKGRGIDSSSQDGPVVRKRRSTVSFP